MLSSQCFKKFQLLILLVLAPTHFSCSDSCTQLGLLPSVKLPACSVVETQYVISVTSLHNLDFGWFVNLPGPQFPLQ